MTYEEALALELRDYIARASAIIAKTDARYGGHRYFFYQGGAANVEIAEAQHHETRIALARREISAIDERV